MRYSTTAIVMAAMTIGEAVAGPAHAHLHRHAHEKKDVDWDSLDWDNMGINWSSAWAAGQAGKTGAASPAATGAAAPATTGASLGDVTTAIVSGVEGLFGGVVGASNSRTTFGSSSYVSKAVSNVEGDFYSGETGTPYGSNIIKVASTSGYDFTATFVNPQSSDITVNCWNKVGSDKQLLSGSALAPTDTSLTFVLPAGKSQVVAFMDNTQGSCAQSCSEKAASGAFATTWMEFNLKSSGSGYDVSAIMNSAGNNYDMSITSKEAPGCSSTMTENMWLTATLPVGTSDGSCYIAQGTATLTVTMGGTV